MDRQIIIYYLQNQDLDEKIWTEAKQIRSKMINLQNEREELKKEIIHTIQTSVHLTDMPKGSGSSTDLYSVIEKTDIKLKEYEKELQLSYNKLIQQYDEFQRIHLVFGTLLPEEKSIIDKLYIKNEKWEAVENELNINHSTLVYTLKDIFDNISSKYESNISNKELARQKNTARLIVRPKKKKAKSGELAGQMNVYDYF